MSAPRGMSVVGSSVVGMDQRTGTRPDAHDGAHDGVVEDDGCLDNRRLGHGSDGVEDDDAVDSGVDGLDVAGVGAVLVEQHAALLAAEAFEVRLVAQWADLHGPETVNRGSSGGGMFRGTERARPGGADGTPWVAEFAAAELGVLLAVSPVTAAIRIRDAVDLRHRHPLLWAAVQAGRVRAAQARAVTMATASAGLSLAQAPWVDEQTTGYLESLPWGQVLALVSARIIAADPAGAEARRRAAALEQFVWTGRSTEHGLKTFIAKAAAGDVIVMVAMIDRIAGLLLLDGDTRPISLRRATAFGLLANPLRALALLQRHATTPLTQAAPQPHHPDRPQDHPDGGDPANGDGVDGGSGGSITDSGDEADQDAGDHPDQPMDDSGGGGGGGVSE